MLRIRVKQISNKDDILRVGTREILRQTLNVQQGKRNVENARKKDIAKNVAKQNTRNYNSRRGHATVRNVETDNNDQEPHVFTVNADNVDFTVDVGGVTMPIIVGSEASVNVIDRSMWEFLKKSKIKCESRLSDKKMYAYGNTQPLSVTGSFIARVSVGDKSVDAEFYVVEEKGQALLGKTIAMSLGILKSGVSQESVNSVSD